MFVRLVCTPPPFGAGEGIDLWQAKNCRVLRLPEKIIETSGNREFDNAALFALRKSNPLRSLPDDLKQEKDVIVNFTFDYNVKK